MNTSPDLIHPTFKPAGDSAVLVQFGNQIDPAINQKVHLFAEAILRQDQLAILETVPGYSTLLVHYDPGQIEYSELIEWLIKTGQEKVSQDSPARLVEIPVVYGGEYGPDLEFVAEVNSLKPADVIQIHSSAEYTVYMMGFMPGFPYLGGLSRAIAAPRMETPRKLVPAGSVGIAGMQTGVYPLDSPGGWRIIGWTPVHLFDAARANPFLLAPGDHIRFVPAPPAGVEW